MKIFLRIYRAFYKIKMLNIVLKNYQTLYELKIKNINLLKKL